MHYTQLSLSLSKARISFNYYEYCSIILIRFIQTTLSGQVLTSIMLPICVFIILTSALIHQLDHHWKLTYHPGVSGIKWKENIKHHLRIGSWKEFVFVPFHCVESNQLHFWTVLPPIDFHFLDWLKLDNKQVWEWSFSCWKIGQITILTGLHTQ